MFLKLRTVLVIFCILMVFCQLPLVRTALRKDCLSGSFSKCAMLSSCFNTSYINVMWTEFKPYAYNQSNGTISGIIPGVDETQDERTNLHFVSLLKKPSVVYVTKKESTSEIPKKLIAAVLHAWPVMIFALLLSLISGAIIWILEFWFNPDEFPRSFVRGTWEGFWWAFVSMTTVGYGDRAPKTLLGRGFAVFWIMLGICIFSIFNATLTTSLTAISLEEKKTLSRAKVGALQNSYEAFAGVKNQAKITNYNSTDDLFQALNNNDVEGILLDSYFSGTNKITDIMKKNELKISETVIVDDRAWGILLKSDKCSCFFRKKSKNSEIFTDLIAKEFKSKSDEYDATARTDSVFNPTGDVFWPSLITCVAFLGVMAFLGIVWEFFLRKTVFKGSKTNSCPDASNLDKMEEEMVKKLQSFFAEWREQRKHKIGTASATAIEDVKLNRMPTGRDN
ncbi:uncharacterized protein LOC124449439 isoform X2 [Xenia sp. Carnegie-2017]|uniref:uncharacterized protein LOC124449439 isoform X2 n=1 Tax=Xenia sp. Carnegie-2017 TaxID=2897299 RepID=UPI001F04C3C3|nr:uncharacterized protein LOC124449439 isoform X2 [Xenia sp. Carnegie-2017]